VGQLWGGKQWKGGELASRPPCLPSELGIDPIRAEFGRLSGDTRNHRPIEFQTTYASQPPLPLRMADYYIRLLRRFRSPVREVEQFVVLLTRPPENTAIEEVFRAERMVHRCNSIL
jgi:hypothetical protein